MVLEFLGTNPILNALPYCETLTSIVCECSLTDQIFYFFIPMLFCLKFSPFHKMFSFELPGTEFSRTEHIWNPRSSCPALKYSVLFCFSTKPETKIGLHTALHHLHPKHTRLMLLTDHHILSYPAWTQPQNLSQQSTGNNHHHLTGIGV